MGIINWVQSRFNGKTEKRGFDGAAVGSSRGNSLGVAAEERWQIVPEEEHLNNEQWPHQAGLLSIGTFGKDDTPPPEGHRAPTHDLPEFTIEEVKKLQDALVKLLRRARSKSSAGGSEAGGEDGLPLDWFLNCPSSLEVDRRVHRKREEGGADGENGDMSPSTKIILTKARDLLINNSSNSGTSIKNKSFKFLLKKMFVCNGGFTPPPSLKDPVESRMEKFLRTVLGRKINVRPSNATATRKYFLEDRPKGKTRGDHRRREEEDEEEKGEDSCRWEWDRTDSEFIVLEI